MEKKELQATLAKLHAELAEANAVDDDTRKLLLALTDDIERLADESDEDSAEPLGEQVNDLILRFEAEHPQLTAVLNQVSAALSNLGI